MAITRDDLSYMSGLLGTTDPNDLTAGMTDEQKKKAMQFTEEEPNILQRAARSFKPAVERATAKADTLLAPKQSVEQTTKRTQNVGDTKPKAVPERDEYVTKLEPEEQKIVQQTVTETQQEIQQAAEDPSLWQQAAEQLGIAGDYAMDMFKGFDNPLERVDWLTLATVYAASRSQGNNATMAIANGLMRGMESKGRQQQAQALMELNQQKATSDQANKDRQFLLDKYEAQSGRMQAEAAKERAAGSGKDLLAALTADERKIGESVAESVGSDTALAYEAINQLKTKGLPVSALAVKRTIEQMVQQGYAKEPFIGDTKLL